MPAPVLVKEPAPEITPPSFASVVAATPRLLVSSRLLLIVIVGLTVPVVLKVSVGVAELLLVTNCNWFPCSVSVGAVPEAGPTLVKLS